jgi:hypothetical protein
LRATIYVSDVVFSEYLYQFTDYYPRHGEAPAGRRFSKRYGIIGRAWRLSETLATGDAFPQAQSRDEVIRVLREQWGMSKEEAETASHGRPSYLCIALRAREQTQAAPNVARAWWRFWSPAAVPAPPGPAPAASAPVQALLFVDSKTPNAFGAALAPTIARELEAHDVTQWLASAITEAMKSLRAGGPFLSISMD